LDEATGVVPRAVADLFRVLEGMAANAKVEFSVSCQLIQIYNERIYDLMQDRRRENPLQLRDSKAGASDTVHVRGVSVYRVYSQEEAMQLLRQGMRNRAIRATDFNAESSRSHTILQLFVTVEEPDGAGVGVIGEGVVVRRSTFSLVDLAGSEKWRSSLSLSQSGNLGGMSAQDAQMQVQLKEMTNINTSLHVLGNCVSALIDPHRKHIPFRDSVLTRLLQDPLGGGGRTVLIATVHADATHREETYSTLHFAARASRIKVRSPCIPEQI
ncbi:kinesin motor domain-containing protein, partial [Ochromonadaceae sp. CCMP2298]